MGETMKRKNLMKWEIDQNLKRSEIAKKLGISAPHYGNIVNGKVDPSIKVLEKFQDIFKVDDVLNLFKKVA